MEVLDARNPQGTRSSRVENYIRGQEDKWLMLVLNKADLVPKEVVKEWQSHLKQDFPTYYISAVRPGHILGFIKKMKDLVKQHPSWDNPRFKQRVLIVGYPNSGKSTLIQAITENKKKVRSSSQAGFTRGIQLITLSDKIYLIDSPGVIPPAEYDEEVGQALDSCSISPQKIIDKETVVEEIERRVSLANLNRIYEVDAADLFDFIEALGRKRGYLAKGGVVREDEVRKLLIMDWQQNKIPFYYRFDKKHPSSLGIPSSGGMTNKK